ncbi:hypothetical protein PI20285_04960 [Pediococcus inopinatus]|nr:hypothetical protein PI20285_04960 [Pediococcus inopinatus]KRN61003.1 glycoside hydrolase [Pediococcus inopinatus]
MKKKVILIALGLIISLGIISMYLVYTNQSVTDQSNRKVTVNSSKKKRRKQMAKIPASYRKRALDAQRGKVERITYQTTYQNKRYQKKALVYLPVGYNPNDSQRYNILYLLHGAMMSEASFLGGAGTNSGSAFKMLLDHEIAAKEMKPTIVVTPSYYPNNSFKTSDYVEDDPLNLAFARNELPNDLMPAVEKRYRTYARTADKKGFVDSRDHRAFGGFSMGAITTWYVFEHDLNLFKYYVPMAGDSWTVEANGGGTEPKKTAIKLAKHVQNSDYQANDFLILASVGGTDGTSSSMAPQIKQMRQHPQQFTKENLIYHIDSGGGHDIDSAANQAYNAFSQLFETK